MDSQRKQLLLYYTAEAIEKYKRKIDELKSELELCKKKNLSNTNSKQNTDYLNNLILEKENIIRDNEATIQEKENIIQQLSNQRNNSQFVQKCKKYNELESNSYKLLNLNQYEINKKIIKMNSASDPNVKNILSAEVGRIYYNDKLRNLNESGLIDKTCSNLSKLIGGANQDETKMGKYLNKLNLGASDKSDIYAHKIKQYVNNMNGGGNTLIDVFSDNTGTYIKNIIEGRYKLISDLNLLKNVINKNKVSDCVDKQFTNIDADEDNDNLGFKKYDYNLKIGCFQSIVGMTKEKIKSEKTYLFKKFFNTLFTDVYVQDYLDVDTYSLLTNYLYFTMVSAFKQYIQIYNQYNNIKLDDNDIILMYKGGNTIRFYISNLYKKINFGESPKARAGKEALKKIQQGLSRGDWDYYVYIDYKRLVNVLTTNQINTVRKHVEQLTSFILYKIKGQLYDFLKASFVKNNLGAVLNIKLWSQMTYDRISEFIKDFNDDAPLDKKINTIQIDNVVTFDNIVRQNSIEELPLENRGILDKKSFNIIPTNKSEIINGSERSSVAYLEVFNFFLDNKLGEYLPSKDIISPIYVQFTDNMHIVHNYVNVIISLFRLKLNNKLYLKINDKTIPMNIPVELIDVSISHLEDNKIHFTELFNTDGNSKKMQDLNIILDNNSKLPVSIPSADYMFYDINIIIIKEILFMWQEKKYDKRITRSLLLSLICMIQRRTSVSLLLNQYNQFSTTLRELNNINNVDGKYNYIINKFSPFIEILDQGKSYQRRDLKIPSTFNFYLDTVFCKHIQHIIVTKYITDIKKSIDVSTFRYKDYCEYLLAIHKDIEVNARDYGVNSYTAVTPYTEIYLNIENIFNDNFDTFEKNILAIINNIIVILEGIVDSNIDIVNLSFDDIKELF